MKAGKTLGFILSVILVISCIPFTAFADTVQNGSCGENVTYTLDSDGLLTISGFGDMEDYYYFDDNGMHTSASPFDGNTAVRAVVIENGITHISNVAFRNCTELASISVPDSVTSIGEDAFEGTAWLENQPDGVVYAGKILFAYKGEMPAGTSVTVEDSTRFIADGAFAGESDLVSITIPEGVSGIGRSAFTGCTGLSEITVPDSVTDFGWAVFEDCSGLKSVTLGSGITSVTPWLFCRCSSLSDVTLGTGTESIGMFAFDTCTGLEEIIIPEKVTSVDVGAFEGCENLKTVYFEGSEEAAGGISIAENNDNLLKADIVFNYTEAVSGDVNGDGRLTTNDVKAVLRHVAGLIQLDEAQQKVADFNGDGKVTTNDAKKMLRTIAGLE